MHVRVRGLRARKKILRDHSSEKTQNLVQKRLPAHHSGLVYLRFLKFERTGSQIERGVGISTIIDSTSKYKKELIGTKCTYAVNRTKDMVFGKSVCKVSDKLYKKLTQ